MPKHFRQCNFCTNNTVNKADVVIFSVNEHMRCALNIQAKAEVYICEDHFETEDVRTHGSSKRLNEGSLPVHFPRTQSVLLDHSYVKTAPLDLESEAQDVPDEVLSPAEFSASDIAPVDDSDIDFPVNYEVENDDIPDSQSTGGLESSGSVYMPSQASAESTCSENNDIPDSQNTSEGVDLAGCHLIVSWSCLLTLLSKCQKDGCSDQVLPGNMDLTRNGAAVKVTMTCNSGHDETWSSSRNVGKGRWTMPHINLLLIVFTFMTGLQFDPLKALFDRCKILTVSSTTYYRYLRRLLYPVIWTYWLMDQALNLAAIMKRGTSVTLCGDARYDSPGFSAKYATYLVQEVESKKIIALEVGMKGQVKASGQMEVNAAERLLKYLVSCGLNIRVFATDRSTSVRTMMAKVFPWIKHQFDLWHFSKGINKRLFKSFKLKSCPNLKLWQKSVTNMIWWSISSSIGNAPLAKQKILSIFHHVANVHTFPAFTLFQKCQHSPIVDSRPWIKAGSLEMKKLRQAVLGKNGRNLDDLSHMDEFVHTSDIESLNSLILKYSSKSQAFGWLGMLIRSTMAVLDFNYNIQRKTKIGKDGEPMYKMKVDRTGTKVTIVEQKEKKDFSFEDNILDLCLQCLDKGVVPEPVYPLDQEAIMKRKHSFKKEDLVKNYRSRMQKTRN